MILTILRILFLRLRNNPLELLLLFVMPILFFSIFAVIFSNGISTSGDKKLRVGWIAARDNELSLELRAFLESNSSLEFSLLSDQSWRVDAIGSTQEILVDSSDLDSTVSVAQRSGQYDLIIKLPQDFPEKISDEEQSAPCPVVLVTDGQNPMAVSVVSSVISGFFLQKRAVSTAKKAAELAAANQVYSNLTTSTASGQAGSAAMVISTPENSQIRKASYFHELKPPSQWFPMGIPFRRFDQNPFGAFLSQQQECEKIFESWDEIALNAGSSEGDSGHNRWYTASVVDKLVTDNNEVRGLSPDDQSSSLLKKSSSLLVVSAEYPQGQNEGFFKPLFDGLLRDASEHHVSDTQIASKYSPLGTLNDFQLTDILGDTRRMLERAVQYKKPDIYASYFMKEDAPNFGKNASDSAIAVTGVPGLPVGTITRPQEAGDWFAGSHALNAKNKTSTSDPVTAIETAVKITVENPQSISQENPRIAMYAAGIVVLFVLFSATGNAAALLEEAESGTLDRIMIGKASLIHIVAGKWLGIFLVGFLQISVMFLWAELIFKIQLGKHLVGFLIMTASTAAATSSFAMLLATMVKSRSQLNAASVVLILSMSAVGGSMIPRFVMSDRLKELGKWTFNAWALDGYQKVFWYQSPVSSLQMEVAVLLSSAVVFGVLALILSYRWKYGW